jgi:hypothetical protein
MNEIQPAITTAPTIDQIAPALARDLAQDLYSPEQIIAQHNLDRETVVALLGSDTFKAMIVAAKQEWATPGNAKSRAQIKAQLAVEESIIDMYQIVQDAKEPATSRVAAFAQLKAVGKFEATPTEQMGSGGPGFSVVINLGPKSLEVSAPHSNVAEAEVIDGDA